MEYIYSALILNSVGKPITEEGITEILKAAGVTPDPAKVKSLVSSLQGVNIEEAIKASLVTAQPVAEAEPKKKEEKKEEK
ncbi:MAG: 50S ribosomal protein L12, partial [Thermoplasmatales archaeon]